MASINPYYNNDMGNRISLATKFYRLRARFYRRNRLLFASPAEVRLLRVMGGRVLTLPFWRHPKTKFPAIMVISMGQVFKRERIRREIRVGSKFIDFGNDIKRGIEVDGYEYHGDIVKQVERDEYFANYNWSVLHIDARDLWRDPRGVRKRVVKFLMS